MSRSPVTCIARLRRSFVVFLALLVAAAVAPATASAKFGLSKLRLGSSSGAENYIYTDGNAVFAQASVDRSSYYRFTVLDSGGSVRSSTGCIPSMLKKTANSTWAIQPTEPVTTTTGWRFKLEQWTNAACGGAPAKTDSLYFDIARASSFGDVAGTTPKQSFGVGETAYLDVAGVGVVKTTPTNSAQNDWSVTWVRPDGTTACSNTGGGDRPDSDGGGLLPSGGDALQYRPGASGDAWNREANYDAACPAFGSPNEGNWSLRVQKDPTHFVVLPAFRVDATPPDTTLDSGPTGSTSATSADFSFSSSEASSTFECRLDSGSWQSCSSPTQYSGLSEGSHTFDVRALDGAGNPDATPASRTWTVDNSLPAVTLAVPADGSSTSDTTPTFSGDAGGHADDSETVAVKVLHVVGDGPAELVQTLTTTRTGGTWSVTGTDALPEGSYRVHAEQGDGAGNVGSSAEHAFTVDTTAPVVALVEPRTGTVTGDTTPLLSGGGGTSIGDAEDVTVKLYSGSSASGSPSGTVAASLAEDGSWSVEAAPALADGTWTARAEQVDEAGNTGLSRARTFRVDATAPDTSITSGPSDSTASTGASFRFTSPEADSSFECRIDGGDWGACTSPRSYSGLPAGSHSFEVRAVDAAGNADGTPAGRTWTVDTTVPEVTLVNPADDSSTSDTTPTFDGSAGTRAGDASTVTLRVYRPVAGGPDELVETRSATRDAGGSWSVDASPSLPAGAYLAKAEQGDAAGNLGTSATHSFKVDTSAPDTRLTLAPAGSTSSTSQTFRFESTEPGSTFECRLDGEPWAGCSSPVTRSGVSNGSHTFQVRATDPAGNLDPTAASVTWTVDTSLPALTLDDPADGTHTGNDTPTFSGHAGTAAGDSATVTVKVYRPVPGGPDTLVQTRTTVRSSSDGSWSVQAFPQLEEGDYYAYAEQAGASGTAVSVAHSFSVDFTPPRTSISSGPQGTTAATAASFRFASSEQESTFECRLDGGAWQSCTSPAMYTSLGDGSHTFDVRASDRAGNVDPTAASRSWVVDSTVAAVTLEQPADDSLTNDPTPLFSGDASVEAGDSDTVTLEIYRPVANGPDTLVQSIDTVRSSSDGSWSVAASPPLSDGSYVAYATQDDDGGDTAYSAPRTFTVDTSPPEVTLTAPATAVPTGDSTPTLKGGAGAGQGDSSTVTVKLYAGSSTSGSPVQTLSATRTGGSWSIDAGALGDGTYTARAEQADAAGNTGASSSRTFRVDATAPNTAITGGPSATTTSTGARLVFTASEPASRFECRRDGGAFAPCSSPRTYGNLGLGVHTFDVRAIDPAGNTDTTPATRSWRIVKPPAATAPRTTPPVTSPAPTLRFSFRARRRQRFRRRTRRVVVVARCSARCTLKLSGRITLSRALRRAGLSRRQAAARSLRVRRRTFRLAAGRTVRLRLRLSRAAARRLLRSFRQRRRVTLRLRAVAVRSGGVSRTVRVRVRLRR
jgi:hypothetical protein